MAVKKIHEGIEVWRVFACSAVIITHLKPGIGIFPIFSMIIVRSTDFAVPFFFCVSGYFLSKGLKKKENKEMLALKYINRLMIPFIFWYIIFFLFPDMSALNSDNFFNIPNYFQLIEGRIQLLLKHPWIAISQGPGYHLWYLVGLAIAFFVIGFDLKIFSIRIRHHSMLLLGIVTYLVVFFSDALGWSQLHLRPFAGIFFTSMGYIIEQKKISLRTEIAVGIFSIFFVLHLLETSFWQNIDSGFDETFNISAMFLGISVFLLALSTPVVKPFFKRLGTLGSLTLGVYLIHPLLIYAYNICTIRIDGIPKILLGISAPFLVMGLSFATAYILKKTPLFAISTGSVKMGRRNLL